MIEHNLDFSEPQKIFSGNFKNDINALLIFSYFIIKEDKNSLEIY